MDFFGIILKGNKLDMYREYLELNETIQHIEELVKGRKLENDKF